MQILDWTRLSADARQRALARPAQQQAAEVQAQARSIIEAVRARGDAALLEFTHRFDHAELTSLEVDSSEMRAAEQQVSGAQLAAIDFAIANVRAFHEAQRSMPLRMEITPGVSCQRVTRPINSVGLYVPAGAAPLPSTAIMLAVPAVVAGCTQRIVCTPPGPTGVAHPTVVLAAHRAGATRIFKVGGAQAVAALAYGTHSIPKCDKIFGPGNPYVTAAKQLVANDAAGAAFDLPAGPSEVMVIADDAANPAFVASDLLAQAEHSADAQALLVCVSEQQAKAVGLAIALQVKQLSRRDVLAISVRNIRLIVAANVSAAIEIANTYAPEHLIVQVKNPREWLPAIQNAGAVFLGAWSPESVGDYCSGPNHTLPTYGHARAWSGLGLEDFQKRISVQELTRQGLSALASATQLLAGMEGLDAHARAVSLRLDSEPV
jgi:histidinol dehydrogenase